MRTRLWRDKNPGLRTRRACSATRASKDGNVCANAGTEKEAYCTYALGHVLYPNDYPVDYHFCAYCADDN